MTYCCRVKAGSIYMECEKNEDRQTDWDTVCAFAGGKDNSTRAGKTF